MTQHCQDRACRTPHDFIDVDPEVDCMCDACMDTRPMSRCPGHNEQGGLEFGTQSKVRVYCTCGVWVDSFRDNA